MNGLAVDAVDALFDRDPVVGDIVDHRPTARGVDGLGHRFEPVVTHVSMNHANKVAQNFLAKPSRNPTVVELFRDVRQRHAEHLLGCNDNAGTGDENRKIGRNANVAGDVDRAVPDPHNADPFTHEGLGLLVVVRVQVLSPEVPKFPDMAWQVKVPSGHDHRLEFLGVTGVGFNLPTGSRPVGLELRRYRGDLLVEANVPTDVELVRVSFQVGMYLPVIGEGLDLVLERIITETSQTFRSVDMQRAVCG